MPNRILRDWTDSDKFDGISPEAERLFVRILMKADDYGRFHAESRRVRSACFPLLTTLRPTDIDGWLQELAERRLILRYRVDDRDLLAIPRFRQRLKRSVPKFPPPDGKPRDWMEDSEVFPDVPGTSRNFPLETEAHSETETETETEAGPTCQPAYAEGVYDIVREFGLSTGMNPIRYDKLSKTITSHGLEKTRKAIAKAITDGKGEPISYAASKLAGIEGDKAARKVITNTRRPVCREDR